MAKDLVDVTRSAFTPSVFARANRTPTATAAR
jgi:hypothetical protein